MVKKINWFNLTASVIAGLVGNRGPRHEISFPEKIGDLQYIKTIFKDRAYNKFQFGLYCGKDGGEYIAKQLSLKSPGIDEYWLRNEILANSALAKAYETNGDLILKNFPKIKTPKLEVIFEDSERLVCVTEKITGEDLFALPLEESIVQIERTINYFKFINSVYDFKNEKIANRGFIKLMITLAFSFLGAIYRHPEEYKKILKSFVFISGNLPFLLVRREKAFVHRDISQENIIINPTGDVYVIDFGLSALTHPMWEVVHTVVDCRRREGFLEAFSKTETMLKILSDAKSAKLYKILSLYSGIHLLSTFGRNSEQVASDKLFMKYALDI